VRVSLTALLLLLLVAAVCGALGQAIAGYSVGGCLVSVAVGFVGALIGVWLAGNLGLPTFFVVDVGGFAFPVVWSILGSALLVAVLGFLRGAARR
jgi:uncharacterized membrane protein YeaQ/YmgE (transglycosylase-associated protein family)